MKFAFPIILFAVSIGTASYLSYANGKTTSEAKFLAVHTSILLTIDEDLSPDSTPARATISHYLKNSLIPLYMASADVPEAKEALAKVKAFLIKENHHTQPLFSQEDIDGVGKDSEIDPELAEKVKTQYASKNQLFEFILNQKK